MTPTVLTVILAPFVGSFLGVVARRWPAGAPVARGRSCCEGCGATLGPRELVPVLSFVAQHGRCRRCQAPIHPDHLRIELAACLPPAAMLLVAPGLAPAPAFAGAALGWTLLLLAWLDWREGWLPDLLTLPLTVAALGWTAWAAPTALADHAVAALTGWAALAGLGAAYRRLRGRDGLGGGDPKLLAATGAVLGLAGLGPCLLLAALLGLALGYATLGRKARVGSAVPFGPPLALAIYVMFLFNLAPAWDPRAFWPLAGF